MFNVLLAFLVWLFANDRQNAWLALALGGYNTPNGGEFDGGGASGDW